MFGRATIRLGIGPHSSFQILLRRRTRLTGPWLGYELRTCGTLRASCSAAHGAQVVWPLDYTGRLLQQLK